MYYQDYHRRLSALLDEIFEKEAGNIEKAGDFLAQTLKQDGLLYVFGCGHSHMLEEELFYRAVLLQRLSQKVAGLLNILASIPSRWKWRREPGPGAQR